MAPPTMSPPRTPNPLWTWLHEANVSQTRLAQESNVPQSEISKYALGKRKPELNRAFALERATRRLAPAVAPVLARDWTDVHIKPAARKKGRARKAA